jgi:hypothetical protein
VPKAAVAVRFVRVAAVAFVVIAVAHPAKAATQSTAEAVAREVADSLELPSVELRTDPPPDRVVVSERVSLFLDRWEPVVERRVVGGRRVHVIATPVWMTVDSGTGDSPVTCRGGGRPSESQCSLRFGSAGTWTVSALVQYEMHYDLDGGAAHQLGPRSASGSLQVRVADAMAVNEGVDASPRPTVADDSPHGPGGVDRLPSRLRSLVGPAVAVATAATAVVAMVWAASALVRRRHRAATRLSPDRNGSGPTSTWDTVLLGPALAVEFLGVVAVLYLLAIGAFQAAVGIFVPLAGLATASLKTWREYTRNGDNDRRG